MNINHFGKYQYGKGDRCSLSKVVACFLLLKAGTNSVYFEWVQNMTEVNNIMQAIEAGIKAESVRQKAIANNVANLQTPGYRSLDVRFEELLDKAMESPETLDLADIQSELYEPGKTAIQRNGNDVSLEVEVGKMVKNTLRHKAYIGLLQTKYRQMQLAMDVR